MKINIYGILRVVVATIGLILSDGCEVEPSDDNWDQEKRFFDLYMTHNYPGAAPESSGLYLIENKEGTGSIPDSDDWLILNYTGYILPDDIVADTYLENVARDNDIYRPEAWYGPFKMQNGTRTEGLTEGLLKMREGGEATICFTSDLGYGSKGANLMKSVKPYKSMKYEVELIRVITDIEAYEKARLEAYVDTIPGVDTIHDPLTGAIMYFLIEERNDSTAIAKDSVVKVGYKGYFTDGTIFDESSGDDPFTFTVGAAEGAIEGWNLGLPRFKEGEKGRLFIPYQLAYGESGSKVQGAPNYFSILPYENLIFDIEVLEVNQSGN